jgi:uncharacterized integral membrane protein (TIGR00697 family)
LAKADTETTVRSASVDEREGPTPSPERAAPSVAVVPDPGHEARGKTPFERMTGGQRLYVWLATIFVVCLVLGDVTGGKAAATFVGPVSVGMLLFPVTFLLTDVINDFYGRKGAQSITLLAAAMATFAYLALVLVTGMPTDPESYFTDGEFTKIFGGSSRLFIASIVAFMIGQLLDIQVFQFWKRLTRSKHLWLRATGSTILSQLVDTVTINTIFWGGTAGKSASWIALKIVREYVIKLVVAVLLTPVIYALHAAIVRSLHITPAPAEKR